LKALLEPFGIRRFFTDGWGAYRRHLAEHEVGVRLGSLDDAPSGFSPQYEVWIKRRERWCNALAAEQHETDRPV